MSKDEYSRLPGVCCRRAGEFSLRRSLCSPGLLLCGTSSCTPRLPLAGISSCSLRCFRYPLIPISLTPETINNKHDTHSFGIRTDTVWTARSMRKYNFSTILGGEIHTIDTFETQNVHLIQLFGLFAESTFPFSQIVRYKTEYPFLLQLHMSTTWDTKLGCKRVIC